MKCKCKFEKGNWSCTCGVGAEEIAAKKLSALPAQEVCDQLAGDCLFTLTKGWHAWWSRKNTCQLSYVNIYLDSNGREVEITEVTRGPKPVWDDAEYLGIVMCFSRQKRK